MNQEIKETPKFKEQFGRLIASEILAMTDDGIFALASDCDCGYFQQQLAIAACLWWVRQVLNEEEREGK
jgi:hypothetical protein